MERQGATRHFSSFALRLFAASSAAKRDRTSPFSVTMLSPATALLDGGRRPSAVEGRELRKVLDTGKIMSELLSGLDDLLLCVPSAVDGLEAKAAVDGLEAKGVSGLEGNGSCDAGRMSLLKISSEVGTQAWRERKSASVSILARVSRSETRCC